MKKSFFKRISAIAVCGAMAVQGLAMNAAALYYFGGGVDIYNADYLHCDGSWTLPSNSNEGWWILSSVKESTKNITDTVGSGGNENNFTYKADSGSAKLELHSTRAGTVDGEEKTGTGSFSASASFSSPRNTKIVQDPLVVGSTTLSPEDSIYIDYNVSVGNGYSTLGEAGEAAVEMYFCTDDFYKEYIENTTNYDYLYKHSPSAFSFLWTWNNDSLCYFVNEGTTRDKNNFGALAKASLKGAHSADGTAVCKLGSGSIDPADGVGKTVWLVMESSVDYAAALSDSVGVAPYEDDAGELDFHETYYRAYKFIWVPAPEETPPEESSSPTFALCVGDDEIPIDKAKLTMTKTDQSYGTSLEVENGFQFDFSGIPIGEYDIEVEMDGYIPFYGTCTIKKDKHDFLVPMTPLGDANDDGAVTVTDISLTAAHVKGNRPLEGKKLDAADTNRDGTVNVADISAIAAQVKGIKKIGSSSSSSKQDGNSGFSAQEEAMQYSTDEVPSFDEFDWCYGQNGMISSMPSDAERITDPFGWSGGWKCIIVYTGLSDSNGRELANVTMTVSNSGIMMDAFWRFWEEEMEIIPEEGSTSLTGSTYGNGFKAGNGGSLEFVMTDLYKKNGKEYGIGVLKMDNEDIGYVGMVRK